MKKILLFLSIIITSFTLSAQQSEELEQLKRDLASKKDSISRLQKKANAIQSKIDAMPGWKKRAFGTVGASFSGFNNWFARTAPDATASNIGITINAIANLLEEDYFWRNTANINLGWVKFDDKNTDGDEKYETATDVFNVTSLFGKKLNSKWALSALGEYRTTIIDNMNNPGFLDIGAGFTWTPKSNLVVTLNPGNYNFIFSKDDTNYESSLGAKIVANYVAKYNKLSVSSNFSTFQSYDSSDLSNWTFTNSFGYNLWKGIGIGLEVSLRNNKQEALNFAQLSNPTETLESVDNVLQTFYVLGLSYSF